MGLTATHNRTAQSLSFFTSQMPAFCLFSVACLGARGERRGGRSPAPLLSCRHHHHLFHASSAWLHSSLGNRGQSLLRPQVTPAAATPRAFPSLQMSACLPLLCPPLPHRFPDECLMRDREEAGPAPFLPHTRLPGSLLQIRRCAVLPAAATRLNGQPSGRGMPPSALPSSLF